MNNTFIYLVYIENNKNMKKIILYPILTFMAIFFSSCGNSDKIAVKETGEKFIEAILANDMATARSLVTPETYAKWGNTANFFETMLTPELRANLQAVKSRVSDVVVDGDEAQATLVVGIPSEPIGTEITDLHFIKRGKVWLINEPGILVKEVIHEDVIILDTEK